MWAHWFHRCRWMSKGRGRQGGVLTALREHARGVAEVVATRGPQLIVDTTPLDDESPREMPAALWFIVSSRFSLR